MPGKQSCPSPCTTQGTCHAISQRNGVRVDRAFAGYGDIRRSHVWILCAAKNQGRIESRIRGAHHLPRRGEEATARRCGLNGEEMTIDSLLSELNEHQRIAASMQRQHALVLAGAGCGKTKTIIARTAFLISNGTPAHRIQILTFTRRSASEIVERVRMHLGDSAEGLKASTFHTWCMSLIRHAPSAFGCKGYSVIDRDDQLQLYKVLRGKKSSSQLPTAKNLLDLYSFARNTRQTLDATLMKNAPDSYGQKDQISQVMLAYEARK